MNMGNSLLYDGRGGTGGWEGPGDRLVPRPGFEPTVKRLCPLSQPAIPGYNPVCHLYHVLIII